MARENRPAISVIFWWIVVPLVITAALFVVLTRLAGPAYAADGVRCRVGGTVIDLFVGDPNPRPLGYPSHTGDPRLAEWRDTIVSTQHALDICINYIGGKSGGHPK